MTDYSDRRKEPRKTVMAFILVHDLNQGGLLGYLRDINLQGALVIGEKTLEVNTQTILDIKLPNELPGIAATHLTISGRVARCIEDESPGSFKIGFEFTNISPEQTQIIKALLERYHFQHKTY